MVWMRTLVSLSALLMLAACEPAAVVEPAAHPSTLNLQEVLGGEAAAGFLRAEGQRDFVFPEDHGLHSGYRNEWWYFTGNLQSAEGRRFGFQVTWFTYAPGPDAAAGSALPSASAWASARIWMAHFALTDVATGEHLAFERFSRENPGLAGARSEPGFRLWLEDWQVTSATSPGTASSAAASPEQSSPGQSSLEQPPLEQLSLEQAIPEQASPGQLSHGQLSPGQLSPGQPSPEQLSPEQASPALPSPEQPWLLSVAEGSLRLQLALYSAKPPVLHGEQGLSRKSSRAGNASWYYSLTRMPANGELQLGDQLYQVTGDAWLDREWSTSALDDEQQGWDWFSLQFDDGSEVMYYRLRDAQGQTHPFSAGSVVDVDGRRTALQASDAELQELDSWTGPNGVAYGTRWRLQVAGRDLQVSAVLPDQWMALSLPYWEGAVDIRDHDSGAMLGRGYLEMVR